MEYRNLGNSDLAVSEICLGSMTWGTQNSEAEGHAQIDYALDHGVNFIDTAELYPVNPMSAETVGRTEEIIGSWFARSGRRDAFILASKVAGNGHEYLQNGIDISPQKIRISLEGSLRRLQTDHIDLYQLHWPNRGTYHFRNNWRFDATRQDTQQTLDHIYSSLECLGQLVDEGKIRSIGLSNESCWGSAQFLRIATEHGFPRIVSLQNEYSLLYRTHDLDLAELSHHEQVGLLPYSPLGCGLLTGKYRDGARPAGSRLTLNPDLFGRVHDDIWPVVDAYLAIAQKHGLDPAQMAIAFCNQRPFVTSSIVGATSVEQLAINLGAAELELDTEVLDDIQSVYRRYPLPY
ncbi:MAG: aldo/keto reductase [Gammaproteobacteria bacterium]|jgi:aryl-alcohol dehydrogenase-like predicted oxidoreductase|nr:aldo/keto reductase [Gammaproteobacteria bacterium]